MSKSVTRCVWLPHGIHFIAVYEDDFDWTNDASFYYLPVRPGLPAERNHSQTPTEEVALKIVNSWKNVFFVTRSVRFLQPHASGNSVDFPIEQTYLNFIDEQPKYVPI